MNPRSVCVLTPLVRPSFSALYCSVCLSVSVCVVARWARFRGTFWKCARIGERLSPWVSAACVAMGVHILFWT